MFQRLQHPIKLQVPTESQHINEQPVTMSWKPSSNLDTSFHTKSCNSHTMLCKLQTPMFQSLQQCQETFTAISI
jgi:hypothetical protein